MLKSKSLFLSHTPAQYRKEAGAKSPLMKFI
jgi:hypothetical protein